MKKCVVTAAFSTLKSQQKAEGWLEADGGASSFIIFTVCDDCGSSDGALNQGGLPRSPPESESDGRERGCLWPTCCRLLVSPVKYAPRFIGPPPPPLPLPRCQFSELHRAVCSIFEQKVKALE